MTYCHQRWKSDDFGFYTAQDKAHVHDLHATIRHLPGLDHERLTCRCGGRDFRPTDMEGNLAIGALSEPAVGSPENTSSFPSVAESLNQRMVVEFAAGFFKYGYTRKSSADTRIAATGYSSKTSSEQNRFKCICLCSK